jgi:DNA-binding CsgD family transcriptional regulator
VRWVSLPHVSLVIASKRRKADDMTVEHLARTQRWRPNFRFERPGRRSIASYEHELARQGDRLREALARETALLRQKDQLVIEHEVLSKLFARREDAAARVANLTPRQRQILELVLAGHPSKNIAADIGISQRTVENHRAAIMKKTGTKSLPALARLGLAAAWNEPDEPFVQAVSQIGGSRRLEWR